MLRSEEPQLTPLFNGKDLAGWVNVNCAPGTFTVRDGLIVSTGIPTGVMRTVKQYENFILELEYKHIQVGAALSAIVANVKRPRPAVSATAC